MMDAKEAIAALNAGITEAKEHYERRKDEDDVTMIELFSVCVEALEKVETLEAENARLREKETPKEAISTGYWQVNMGGRLLVECPICGGKIGYLEKFCSEIIAADYGR